VGLMMLLASRVRARDWGWFYVMDIKYIEVTAITEMAACTMNWGSHGVLPWCRDSTCGAPAWPAFCWAVWPCLDLSVTC
jgi:hypothetical protein